jgi:hypothetical protein
MVVSVVMGVLFSAAVVLGESSIYLPIVLKAVGSSSAGVPRTGQTISYGIRDDGALQKGVAWPNPRFTDNANGTVTDNLTGLIWLKNAAFFGARNWATALTDCNTLAANGTTLTDGSVAGDWRLPNKRELFSMIDDSNYNPTLPTGHPFTGVQSVFYLSSTTYAHHTENAWSVDLIFGYVSYVVKTNPYSVWPVRGGQ